MPEPDGPSIIFYLPPKEVKGIGLTGCWHTYHERKTRSCFPVSKRLPTQ